jgi:hypothetical protein
MEVRKGKARRPTVIELRARIVAAIETFIIQGRRDKWHSGLSSHEYRLLIDDEYKVSIAKIAAPATALFLFSDPLVELGLDPWAVELGGAVRDAALDMGAESVVRKLERGKWWVP